MRCQHCNAKPATRPRRLCQQCYGEKEIRLRYPLSDCTTRPRGGRNPPQFLAVNPGYVKAGMSLVDKVDAAFAYWSHWRTDYEAERALRCDLTAIFLRQYRTAERASEAVQAAIDGRRFNHRSLA